MSTEQFKAVPEPTLKRLPLYHRFLKEVQGSGKDTASCTDIGDTVRATIINIDRNNRGINLSVKALDKAEEAVAMKKLAADKTAGGTTNLGALLKAKLDTTRADAQ